MALTRAQLASRLDHTLLAPVASFADVARACREALDHHLFGVCVNPVHVARVAAALAGSGVRTIAVVGFPLGASTAGAKMFEAREAAELGAEELDMVVNQAALRAGDRLEVVAEIAAVVRAVSPHPVKVILETGALDDAQKALGCQLAQEAGAAFVKTSTGFGPGGATVADVALMRRVLGPGTGIKASGGIRTAAFAEELIAAGADRLGTSRSLELLEELED
jgi:deoxyribose-phosphate aldolase